MKKYHYTGPLTFINVTFNDKSVELALHTNEPVLLPSGDETVQNLCDLGLLALQDATVAVELTKPAELVPQPEPEPPAKASKAK